MTKGVVESAHPTSALRVQNQTSTGFRMITDARANGLDYSWVGVDGMYGNDPAFLQGLEALGETFLVDLHKNQCIYLNDPAPKQHEPSGRPGRRPRKLRTEEKPMAVEHWAKQQPATAWQSVKFRVGEKSPLCVEVLCQAIRYWDGEALQAKYWILLVRREAASSNEIKYSLSNAGPMGVEQLAHMQGQRYWIERAFQNAKSHCGLDYYQVRGWQGWHHHMALVMVALQFMLNERLVNEDDVPLLSCADLEILRA